MKRILYIVMLLAATTCFAQQNMPSADNSPCEGWLKTHPYYYCECRSTSQAFQYPLKVQVSDTMWFSTTLDDMKAGLSAYWFADCSITFEVYAFCSSKVPTITMTVGKNQMREMSVEDINAKLDKMGEQAKLLGQILTPRVRVFPNEGGTGTVHCYPYDQGPKSTCDSILPVVPGMTLVCDQPEEVYELEPSRIASTGKGFIRWKQKKNMPGTIRLTEGACDGPEIANITLSDSMRVFVLDSTRMKQIKNDNKSVFVLVTHDSAYVGRIVYRNSIKWDNQRIDTTICQGKTLQLKDTALSESTVYSNDTLLVTRDTLSLTTYYLTVDAPTPQYDTLLLKAAQLPTTYRNQYIAKDGWGDYDFTIHQAGKCDERYLVHVAHRISTSSMVVNDTLCLGKTATYGGVTYSADTIIRDSVWADADTWVIRDITIHFTDPEIEYDTLLISAGEMTANGYWYKELGVAVKGFGDTLIVKTKKNACTRWIQLHVEEKTIETDFESTQEEFSPTSKFLRNGMLYIRREGHEYDLLGRPVKRQQ